MTRLVEYTAPDSQLDTLPSTQVWGRGVARRPGAADRRQRLARVAARLFAAEGVDAIPMSRVAATAGLQSGAALNLYATREDMLADLLVAYLADLDAAVAAAHDRAGPGPEHRLEAVLRAVLDAVAARPDEHRAFLFCIHRLPERDRRAILLRFQVVLETVHGPLAAAIPGLASRPAASETLLGTIRTLLSDPWRWPLPQEPATNQAEARRLAGMLLAAAAAETAGGWPALGAVAGADPAIAPVTLDCRTARARWSEVLRAAESGVDVTVTRRGRRVARVIATR